MHSAQPLKKKFGGKIVVEMSHHKGAFTELFRSNSAESWFFALSISQICLHFEACPMER